MEEEGGRGGWMETGRAVSGGGWVGWGVLTAGADVALVAVEEAVSDSNVRARGRVA